MQQKLMSLLPKDFLEILDKMSKGENPGLLLINGFPVDEIIPTGNHPIARRDQKGRVSENAMLAFAGLMGRKLESNPKEHDGAIVHQIAVFPDKAHTASSKGREPLHFHVEGVHEKKPDFLMLVGLEGDPQASTGYFFIGDFLKDLPEDILISMKKPQFEIRSGDSYDVIEKGTFSLLEHNESTGIMSLRLHDTLHERFKGLNEEADATLKFLQERFNQLKENNPYTVGSVSLQPSQALILNNAWGNGEISGAMHARKGFAINKGRWLQRGYIQEKYLFDEEKIDQGHKKALQDSLTSKQLTYKEAGEIWRNAMMNTKSVQKYLQENPDASASQAVLYGLNKEAIQELV